MNEKSFVTVVGGVNIDISATPKKKLKMADSNPGRMKVTFGGVGRNIAEICDVAILVNKNQSENIKKGLLEQGFDPKIIIYKDTLFEVTNLFKTFLQAGDVILMENDLPDNYK